MSLQQLRLFVTLAQHRSFTQAGNALGVTQSAASRSIRELEDLLDLRLFDRTTRHVALTDTGRALLPRIASLVDELEEALRFGQQVSSAENGAVSIACASSAVASVVPALLASCRASFPNIALTLHDAQPGRVLELLRSGDADLGVLVEPQDIGDLSVEALYSDPLCVVMPARHPLALNASVQWRELSGTDLFLLDDDAGSYELIARSLVEQGASNVRLQRLTQAASVVEMVAASLGIGIMPMHTANPVPTHSLVQTVRLCPTVTRTVMLAKCRHRTLRAQAARIWTQMVSAHHEELKPMQTADA